MYLRQMRLFSMAVAANLERKRYFAIARRHNRKIC
jgi:hypothetical protein